MSYNLLKGKRGIIFGALNDQSIAWKVAERAVEEGATITLSNTPMAIRMGEVNALAEKLNCQIVPADATSVEDLSNVFKTSIYWADKLILCSTLSVCLPTYARNVLMMTLTMECWIRHWIFQPFHSIK